MKVTNRNMVVFKAAFMAMMEEFCDATLDHRDSLITVIGKYNFKRQMDEAFFKNLAREAIVRKMDGFAAGERAVQDVAKFLDSLDDDLEEQFM